MHLQACVRSPIKDFSVLCSAKTGLVIRLFSYSCRYPTELTIHMCLYFCLGVCISFRLRAGRRLVEG